jgi:molybdopterin/thiamine biosynthesis adenylyltransferase
MNLAKSFEFFDPGMFQDQIHIIGCGSVGSTVAELLARFGLVNFCLYDFDVVEEHNLVNQMFTRDDLYKDKVQAVEKHLKDINPDVNCELFVEGWKKHKLSGYVFLCVDNIDLRREIVTDNKFNNTIKAMFDFRTGLTDCQHYAADWKSLDDKKALLNTMNFSHEEAERAVTMSACHVALCVAPTVRLVSNIGVCNFINFVKGEPLKKAIVADAFSFMLEEI